MFPIFCYCLIEMLTLIGRGMSGRLYRKYKTDDTDNMMKNDSTIILYVINV